MNHANLINIIRSEAIMTLSLIDNGEWDRAHRHNRLVSDFLGLLMDDLDIEPMPVHIHDSTTVS